MYCWQMHTYNVPSYLSYRINLLFFFFFLKNIRLPFDPRTCPGYAPLPETQILASSESLQHQKPQSLLRPKPDSASG